LSIIDNILSGTRNLLLLQYKVDQLTADYAKLEARQETLTERVIRLEVIISEAQRAAQRLPALPHPKA
jgi:outer membrane murein-binding lipoprotein Lpp